MSKKRTPLKPTRSPRPEDVKGAGRRAREIAEWIRVRHPGQKFADSTEIVREDRDSRS